MLKRKAAAALLLVDELGDSSNIKKIFLISANKSANINLMTIKTFVKEKHTRISDYFENWIDRYLDYDFYLHFRMTRETFNLLFKEVDCINTKHGKNTLHFGGKKKVDTKKALLFTLWYLAKGDTLISTADRFNIAVSTMHDVSYHYIKLLALLSKKFICWPNTNECKTICEEFGVKGYPDVIGAIDGTHINCTVPEDQQDSYQNRKLSHSIVIQGVCTMNKIFTNVCIGFPGSVHDARVLKESSLNKQIHLKGKEFLFPKDYHLVGDSAYPCLEWLMTPYRDTGRLSPKERYHNRVLSSTRVVIENAFGLLKGRWRILKFVNAYSIQKVVYIATACCMLHNFCIVNKDGYHEEGDLELSDTSNMHSRNRDNLIGVNKRNTICNTLYLH